MDIKGFNFAGNHLIHAAGTAHFFFGMIAQESMGYRSGAVVGNVCSLRGIRGAIRRLLPERETALDISQTRQVHDKGGS
jgi:hypothetical protein